MIIIKGDRSYYQLNKIVGSYIAESGDAYRTKLYDLHIYFGLSAEDIFLARFKLETKALKAHAYLETLLAYGFDEELEEKIIDIRDVGN